MSLDTTKPVLLTVDEYQAKYANVITMTDEMRYGYECLYHELMSGLQAINPQPASEAKRCGYCNGTGEYIGIDGKSRGRCTCSAGSPPSAQPAETQKVGGSYANLLTALQAYQDAFEDLFGQCASNPIRNAWGQKVDMTKLNEARRTASMARAAPFVHKKTGGKYQFLGNARIQTSVSLDDMSFVVVYRGEDGRLWVRPDKEFVDRFMQEGRPNRLLCDDFLEAEADAGGVLAVSPEIYESMRPETDSVRNQFNAAIDFAIKQGSSAAEFLESWREGDTSEWPEFSNNVGDAT